ncbi:MAG: hypothetical protein LW636_11295 [Planctomycetaceae bacterium]|nr:hypothetical protein [Planctomycetaceae bacterium]
MIEWSADCNNDGIVDYGQCRDGSLPDYNGNNIPDCCEQGAPCVVGNYPTQWRVEDGGNGHWYQLRHTGALQGALACRESALSSGGDLASVSSAAESARIVALVRGSGDSYFLGGFQPKGSSEPDGGWEWMDGSPWSFTNWLSGEPNDNGGNEDFLAALPTGTWNDTMVNAILPRFAVEWSADCDSDGIVDYGQILSGTRADTNANGVPDACEFYLVPSEFPTIQAAIDAVPSGEFGLVLVAAGTYTESFSLNGKNVVVRGAPNGATVVDGTGLKTSIATFSGGEPATAGIESLVLRNGTSGTTINPPAPLTVGGALYAVNTSAFARNCRFEGCEAEFGGAVYSYNSALLVEGCVFAGNTAVNDGGGMLAFRCDGSLTGCSFAGNLSGSASAGAGSGFKSVGARTAGGVVLLDGCTFTANTGNVSAAAIEHFADTLGVPGVLRLEGCTLSGNTSPIGAGGLLVTGPQSSCVLGDSTSICGNSQRDVSGPYLMDGAATVCDCEADFLGDGFVNGADLGVVLSAWGLANDQGTGDLTHDGVVNAADLSKLLNSWGACP